MKDNIILFCLWFGFLCIVAPVVVVWLVINTPDALEPRPFDEVLWQRDTMWAYTSSEYADYPRLGMVDDLLERYSFEGLTQAEVVALLGEPRAREEYRPFGLAYFLGPDGVDFAWLAFNFDSTGVVTESRVVQD